MIAAIGMVKDEADVVEATVRHMAAQVDEVWLLDNCSTDGTADILRDLAEVVPLRWRTDDEPGYYQAEKMSRLAVNIAADVARRYGRPAGDPIWIVPFDADELWYNVRSLDDCAYDVVSVPGYDYRPTALDPTGMPFVAMRWRHATPDSFRPKVAFRWRHGARIAQGNHAVTFPTDVARRLGVAQHTLMIRHYPVRSVAQFQRKARNGGRAYDAAGRLPRGWGAHWRRWGKMTDAQLAAEYQSEFFHADPVGAGLVEDPATPLHSPLV